jgi:hypothetical protein
MQRNCARCERKVKSEENWLQAHLWARNAIFHLGCFIALMEEQGEQGAEQAAWKGSRKATEIQEIFKKPSLKQNSN